MRIRLAGTGEWFRLESLSWTGSRTSRPIYDEGVDDQVERHQPGDYVTARALAQMFRVPLGTIYRWASEDHWRRTRYRPIRYHMDDASDSKSARSLTTR